MWKNIFIEASLLAVVIFGGFYINANILKKEISVSRENLIIEQSTHRARSHVSGNMFKTPENATSLQHLCGAKSDQKTFPSFSGAGQEAESKPAKISGNNT